MIFASQDRDPTDIIRYFGDMATRIPLAFGDFAFFGWGEGHTPISISVERKRILDAINSVRDGRLAAQVVRARRVHQVVYIIVEGRFRPGIDGLIELPRRGGWVVVEPAMEYRRLDNSLNTLHHAGFLVRRTETPRETAEVVLNLYHWWQRPPEEHTTGQGIYQGHMSLRGLSLLRRMAQELPGIGWELSARVEQSFESVQEMVGADVDRWQQIEGIGKGKAEAVVRGLGRG